MFIDRSLTCRPRMPGARIYCLRRPPAARHIDAGEPAEMRVQSADDRLSLLGSLDLQRGGRVVARLQWRTQPRTAVGWYLERPRRPARRLDVDSGIDALAQDAVSDPDTWNARADAVALLSTALALDAADRALRGGLAPPPSRPLESGRYELHVTGLDAATSARAFPDAASVAAGDTNVLAGTFDDRALTAAIRRVNLLGGRVLAMFRAAPAGECNPRT